MAAVVGGAGERRPRRPLAFWTLFGCLLGIYLLGAVAVYVAWHMGRASVSTAAAPSAPVTPAWLKAAQDHRIWRSAHQRWAAGYLATAPTGQRFTGARMTFIEPGAWSWTPHHGFSDSDIWAGVGVTGHHGALMQAGTSMWFQDGWPYHIGGRAWWEAYPGSSRPLTRHTANQQVVRLEALPGDRVTVTVRRAGAERWTLQVSDITRGVFSVGRCVPCHANGWTAGWFVEDPGRPAHPGTFEPFAAPYSVQVLAAAASLDGGAWVPLSRLNWQPVCRVSPHGVLAPVGLPTATSPWGPPNAPPSATGGFIVGAYRAAAGHPALCGGGVPAAGPATTPHGAAA